MNGAARVAVGLVLAGTLLAGAMAISPRAEGHRQEREELFYYPSGKFLREAVLGYDQAVAVLAWVRAVQYYGEHKRGDQDFRKMYHLCDIVTDLDPHFLEPYLFGSLIIFTEGEEPGQGLDLLAKGREQNPDAWRIFFESGFVRYMFWRDYEGASVYFQRAAAMPGAPERATRFAAFVTERAGELETSLLLWQQLAEATTNPEFRARANRRIEDLMAQIAARDGRTRP